MSIEFLDKAKIARRAQSIAAMGLVEVNKLQGGFKVSTPSLRGRQTSYRVRCDLNGKMQCNCLEFEEYSEQDNEFACEHILAVEIYTRGDKPLQNEFWR